MMRRSGWAGLAAVLCGSIWLGGCSGGASTTEPGKKSPEAEATGAKRPACNLNGPKATGDRIKIGIVASLNGDQKPWGDDSLAGAQIAVDEVNKAGGIQGKKVQLVPGDSNSNPEQGKSAAEKLLSDGCIALLGEVASGITIPMAKSAFEKGVPIMAIGATKNTVTDIGNNVFRVCYNDQFQGAVMAEFAYKELGLRKLALMTDKKLPYSKGLSDDFREHFTKLGGEIVTEEFYESKQPTFTGQLTNLKQKSPDGVFCSGYFPEVGPIVKQAKDAGLDVKFLGGDGWDSTEIINSGGQAIIGNYFCNHYNNTDSRPQVQEFLNKWRAGHNGHNPGTAMAALGYDAAAVTLDALKRASELSAPALIKALEDTVNFNGVTGSITLKGMNGTAAKRALVVEVRPEGFAVRKAYEFKDISH